MNQSVVSEVLTLEEAANYLRLPLEAIEREASQGTFHVVESKTHG